jgi:hypothetical protein
VGLGVVVGNTEQGLVEGFDAVDFLQVLLNHDQEVKVLASNKLVSTSMLNTMITEYLQLTSSSSRYLAGSSVTSVA